jgi:hypothetical protein
MSHPEDKMTPHPFAYHRPIVGFHGCDRSTVEKVLLHGEALEPSGNDYDWLGRGIYFWEHGWKRALEFAKQQVKRGRIQEPAVLGAYIHLGRCFDLTDTWATKTLSMYHQDLLDTLNETGNAIPRNRSGGGGGKDLLLRNLDCAVINLCMQDLDDDPTYGGPFQTVRGVFVEGAPIYEGAGIHAKTHVQVAVRDPACILGYFLPNEGYTSK